MTTACSDYAQILNQTQLVARFLRYVAIETTSDEKVLDCPSSSCQWNLARTLADEARALGLERVETDGNGYLTAILPGNRPYGTHLGWIAHMDTSPAFSGHNVRPQLHPNYSGGPIKLRHGVIIDPQQSPELNQCIGDTIITSDGTTLLGADDKAGIAEIMSALEYLIQHPQLPRPTIHIAFTPDEEIGRGWARFPLESFGAQVAFTVDGGFDGEINIENFNADSVIVTFDGISTHPGTAKGKMVNALRYLGRFLDQLPKAISPEETEERQGFVHPVEVTGDATRCQCHLILRDFEQSGLVRLHEHIAVITDGLRRDEPRLKIAIEDTHSYPNMFEFLKDLPELRNRLQDAVQAAGLIPRQIAIRGGTDGAHLTRMGLPCPNIFTGGVNYHGPTEFISTRSMAAAVCTLINLAGLFASKPMARIP